MDDGQAAPLTARRRRRIGWWIGVALVILVSGGAVLYSRQGSGKGGQEASKGGAPASLEFAPADVALVEQKVLGRTVSVYGSLMPATQSLVKATVAGQVLRVLVREGDAVRKGQLLAEIDASDLRSRLDAALADQDERRSRLTIAAQNRDTNQALLKQNFISKNAFDQTQSVYQGSEAAVQWSDAQVKLAQKSIADAVVRSPISGRVAKRLVNAGERVMPDAAILSVVDLSRLELEATVPASDVPLIAIGQTVRFSVAGFDGRSFEGRVDRINPVAEAGSRSIKLFVAVANDDGSLRGGMFAAGAVTLSQSAAVPVVPMAALFEEAGQSYVFTIESGKLAKHAVATGQKNEALGLAEIKSGLESGATVVRVRMAGLKVGTPATVLSAQATAKPA